MLAATAALLLRVAVAAATLLAYMVSHGYAAAALLAYMETMLLLCWRTWKCCFYSAVKRAVKLIDSPSEFTNPPSTTPLVVESRYKSSFYHPLVVESRFTCFLLVSSSLLLLPCLNGRVTFQLFPPLCCWSLLGPVAVKTQLLPSR